MEKAAAVMADRELLGVRAHADIQKEIEQTRAAYERLKASGQLSQAELAQAALKTEERVRELKSQTNGWTESLGKAKLAISGLAASGAGLAAVAKRAIDFESAMADVAKVVGGTDEQVAQLASRIKAMTATIPLAATELAAMAAAGGQLGVPIEKLDQFVLLSAQMATAFGMSAEQAGEAVAKLSNIFNLPMDQVGRLGDAINTLGNNMAAKEADIVEVLTRIGGAAGQFGLTAEQAGALGASMLSLGVSAEVAGTGINAILSKLQTAGIQGKEFQSALAGMGLSAKQLAADIAANPQKALEGFLQTLSQLEGAQKAEVLAKLFGQEYQDDVARLLAGLGQYEKALELVGDKAATAGAMQKEFETRVQTTAAQLQLLKNAVEVAAINLGSVLLPMVQQLASGVSGAARAVAEMAEQFPELSRAATVLVTLAANAATLRLAWLAIGAAGTKVFGGLGGELGALNVRFADLARQSSLAGAALKSAGLLAAAGWAGWSIGSDLRQQFVEVEQAGIALAAGLTKLAARAQAAWEMLKAPFTDDTVAAAQQRLHESLAQIDADYAELFDSAAQARDAQQQQAAASDAAAQAVAHQAEQTLAAAQAQQQLGQALASGGAEAAVRSFEALAAGAGGAAKALEAMRAQLDLGDMQSVAAFGQAMDGLRERGTLSARQVSQAWQEALGQLDTDALARFGDELGGAFDKGLLSAQAMFELNERVLMASFDKLGANAAQALGRVSDGAQEAIGAFDVVRRQVQAAGLSAQQVAAGLEAAFAAATPQADSMQAIEQLQQRLSGVADAGLVGADGLQRMQQALDAQRRSVEQQLPGIQSLQEALRQLGVTPQAELDALARKAREAFDRVRGSGAASARETSDAWRTMAQAQIEASGGVADATLRAQAAQHGFAIEADAAGKAVIVSMQEAARATENVGRAARRAGEDSKEGAREAAEGAGKVKEGTEQAEAAHQKLAKTVQHTWLSASAQASQYAQDAARHAQNMVGDMQKYMNGVMGWGGYISAWNSYYADLRRAADGYVQALQRIDEQQQRIQSQDSGPARAIEDLRLRLLELNGTEEEVARARTARDKAEVQRQIELARLEMERATLRGDTAGAARLRQEMELLNQQIALIGQVAAAEKKRREQNARDKQREG
ncbi:MAG: phage tail tape measure protein, partial [Pseudomonadota bacterium]|nr:phage tail tape measure protein [Pseudomonadota bacterium]